MIKIEEVRELPFVGNWYRPPARSTLMRLPKADLIEYISLEFPNWAQVFDFIRARFTRQNAG